MICPRSLRDELRLRLRSDALKFETDVIAERPSAAHAHA